jgi:hypothetical protein
METAAAILTQIIFENETKAHNLNTTEGGLAGSPEEVAKRIQPFYAAMLKMVRELK